MQKSKPDFVKTVAIVLIVAIPVTFALKAFALKFMPGVHILTFITFKDKTVIYGMVALWNACLAYLTFRQYWSTRGGLNGKGRYDGKLEETK